MKTAKKTPVAYDLACPYCQSDLYAPDTGSIMWTRDEITAGQVIECFQCKKQCKLPKV